MATWQERMAVKVDEAFWSVTISGAYGWWTVEDAVEYSRLDALTLARAGYWGEYAQADANSKDIKVQKRVADYGVRAARAAGLKVIPDVTERQLGKGEFFARRAIAVDQMMQSGSYATVRDAVLEWNMREAERETGIKRNDTNRARVARLRRTYRALCNRDRKG